MPGAVDSFRVGTSLRPSAPSGARRRQAARWRRCLPLLLFVIVTPVRAEVSKEYQVKAAYVYNFTKFVEWPEGHFQDEHRAIVIAILGRNPFGDELEKILQGRTVGGRPLTVKILASAEEAKTVDVLFVCEGEEKRLESLWERSSSGSTRQ